MPRIARVVVPGLPHHITQRGVRRMRTFSGDQDCRRYIELMSDSCKEHGVEIWAYCLMPNHSHLIGVPESEESLRWAIGEAHRLYTHEINKREGCRGYLWQGRFASYPMDERHTIAAARYIELNPVRAGIVSAATDYPWSSAAAHLRGRDDRLVRVAPLLDRIGDWRSFLGERPEPEIVDLLRRHTANGVPLGSDAFVKELERKVGRELVTPALKSAIALSTRWKGAA
ncbi:MAG: transposase [Myxococcales bacterium]